MKRWQFQEAKAHLEELVQKAITHGPQEIFIESESVTVISKKEYDRLVKPKSSFLEFMRQSQ